MIKKLICVLAVGFVFIPGTASAALVGFLGTLNGGIPGGLGSLPRDFVMTLDFVDSGQMGSAPGVADFEFKATPTADNPDTNYGLSTSGSGIITVINGLTDDRFSFDGALPFNNGLSPTPVNFSFTFIQSADTIDSNEVSSSNIAKLIAGAPVVINFAGGVAASPSGTIQAAPEPGTMLALTGLVLGGCGIGYRRRKQRNEAKANDAE